jgi:hypothetical protein
MELFCKKNQSIQFSMVFDYWHAYMYIQKKHDPNRFTISASQLLSKRWCNNHRDGFDPRKKRIETNAGWQDIYLLRCGKKKSISW